MCWTYLRDCTSSFHRLKTLTCREVSYAILTTQTLKPALLLFGNRRINSSVGHVLEPLIQSISFVHI